VVSVFVIVFFLPLLFSHFIFNRVASFVAVLHLMVCSNLIREKPKNVSSSKLHFYKWYQGRPIFLFMNVS